MLLRRTSLLLAGIIFILGHNQALYAQTNTLIAKSIHEHDYSGRYFPPINKGGYTLYIKNDNSYYVVSNKAKIPIIETFGRWGLKDSFFILTDTFKRKIASITSGDTIDIPSEGGDTLLIYLSSEGEIHLCHLAEVNEILREKAEEMVYIHMSCYIRED